MQQVWKCDHCHVTSEDKIAMIGHEQDCYHNPVFRKCYSCKYYDYDTSVCDLELDTNEGEEGKCPGWEQDY